MKPFLPFSKPSISEEEIEALAEVLRSGWITTGPRTAQFEKEFSAYCGAAGSVALSSATAAIQLVLAALEIGPGDEVVTPSMTWVSTVNMIVLAGAKPVFADIDQGTLMVTAETIRPCLSPRTRLIIPVHFAGAALDMTPIRQLAAENDIALVEDAAHAVGTEYKGTKIGATGISAFSFHPIKNITTGEGGMLCCDDPELLDRFRRLKFHGLTADAHDRKQQGRSPHASVVEPGYKYNLTDIAAQLGIGQLARLEHFISARTKLARRYLELFKDIDEIKPLEIPSWQMRHAWHLFVIRLDTDKSHITRDQFIQELQQMGIGTGIHFIAAHQHPYYRRILLSPLKTLPATDWNSDRICSLPLFPSMTLKDVDRVVAAVKKVLGR